MKPLLFLALFAAASCASVSGAIPISAKPTLLSPEDGPSLIPALRIESKKEFPEWTMGRPDRYGYFAYELKSTVSTKPELNDEPTTLDATAGIHWNFDRILRPSAEFGGHNAAEKSVQNTSATSVFGWGAVSAEIAFAFEGDEPMRNRQWAYGGKLIYTPYFDSTHDRWWIPLVWIDYRRVDELGSSIAEKLGVSRQEYWRFGAMTYWQVEMSNWVRTGVFLKNLKIVAGLQYHRSTDRELGLAGGDLADAYATEFGLEYNVPNGTPGWLGKLKSVYLKVSDGRIPPATENRTTFSISVDLDWKALVH